MVLQKPFLALRESRWAAFGPRSGLEFEGFLVSSGDTLSRMEFRLFVLFLKCGKMPVT